MSWLDSFFGGLPPTGPAGGDLAGTFPNPTVLALRETSGPTQLVTGAVADGQYLRRSGGTLIGDTAPAPTGSASGDLSGTYPNPAVAKLQGRALSNSAPAVYQQIASPDGSTWAPTYPVQPSGSVEITFGTTNASTSDGTAFTVPASPTGNGRFLLMLIMPRVSVAIVGGGTVAVRVGTTTGGNDIATDQTISSATTVGTIISGQAISTLGTAMTAANGYSAILNPGATVKIRATTTGILSAGKAALYVYGAFLP